MTLNEGTMIQVKNPHQPNYEFEKVMTLAKVQWDVIIANLNQVDPKDNFEFAINKWIYFLNVIISNKQSSPYYHNHFACKDKLRTFYKD